MNYPQIDSWQNTRIALGGNSNTKANIGTVQRSSTQSGTPLPVILSAVTAANGSTGNKTVTCTYQINPSDQSLQQVAFWVKGYQGNSSATKITEASSSPITFTLQATGESVSVIAQSIGKDGSILDLTKCPSKGITL